MLPFFCAYWLLTVCCNRFICVVPCSSTGRNSLTTFARAVRLAARSRKGMP